MPTNLILARSAVSFAAATTLQPAASAPVAERAPSAVLYPTFRPELLSHSLPAADTANGSLFLDRDSSTTEFVAQNSANVHWYLPGFVLAADVDPTFEFAASQTTQEAGGLPFNVAKLTLQINKIQPADVVQFVKTNPTTTVQEVPLTNLAAVLSSQYTDQNGHTQQRNFSAANVLSNPDGSLSLTFDGTSILGDSVVALYQDLRVFGKAAITLNASYQAWTVQGQLFIPGRFRYIPVHVGLPPEEAPPVSHAGPPYRMAMMAAPENAQRISPQMTVAGNAVGPAAQPPPTYAISALSFTAVLPLRLKYNGDGYQLRYTVSTLAAASRVILGVSDLSTFNQSQTQFSELKALGDLSLMYPSLSTAYFGVLSRTIVLIPQRYSIVRGKSGCSAVCLARVDSSAASTSQSCFEFSFIIAPEVNRIELFKLQAALASSPDFQGYQITFPDFMRDSPASSLQTTFKSSAQFAAGGDAHTFGITVTVQDDGPDTPAVANANLFILRLCSQTGADLLGSLSLKLDDGYVQPVLAAIDLNFAHTAGSDELVITVDDTDVTLQVTNQSPLDLQISEYALIQGTTITEVPGIIKLAAAAMQSLRLPADHTGITFAPVAQLALPAVMGPQTATQFLNFQTVDVQSTQYVITVEASGVDFVRVASIVASITFSSLPSLAAQTLALSPTVQTNSAHIVIPIANAVFSLPGVVSLTVQYADPAIATLSYTVQNDFTSNPVLSILQADIDSHLPPPTS